MAKEFPSSKSRRILAAAGRLLVQRGFEDVTLDEVARRARVAHGTVFLYYRNKDELIRAVFSDLVGRLGADLDRLASSKRKGLPLLRETVGLILSHFDRNKDFLWKTGAGHCRSDRGNLVAQMRSNVDRLGRILASCGRAGGPRVKDPRRTASMIFALCRHSVLYRFMTGREESAETRARKIVDVLLHGAFK